MNIFLEKVPQQRDSCDTIFLFIFLNTNVLLIKFVWIDIKREILEQRNMEAALHQLFCIHNVRYSKVSGQPNFTALSGRILKVWPWAFNYSYPMYLWDTKVQISTFRINIFTRMIVLRVEGLLPAQWETKTYLCYVRWDVKKICSTNVTNSVILLAFFLCMNLNAGLYMTHKMRIFFINIKAKELACLSCGCHGVS